MFFVQVLRGTHQPAVRKGSYETPASSNRIGRGTSAFCRPLSVEIEKRGHLFQCASRVSEALTQGLRLALLRGWETTRSKTVILGHVFTTHLTILHLTKRALKRATILTCCISKSDFVYWSNYVEGSGEEGMQASRSGRNRIQMSKGLNDHQPRWTTVVFVIETRPTQL